MEDLIDWCAFKLLQVFKENRDDPPLAKNMTPVAGRIKWVRVLFRKIEKPLNYIKVNLILIYIYVYLYFIFLMKK